MEKLRNTEGEGMRDEMFFYQFLNVSKKKHLTKSKYSCYSTIAYPVKMEYE